MGTHWVAFYVQNNDVTYFDSFGVEHKTLVRSQNLSVIKTQKQIYSEYKHMIQ